MQISLDILSAWVDTLSMETNTMRNKLSGFDAKVLFTAIPQSVLDNQKRYQAEADEVAKNRKMDCQGEECHAWDCPIHQGK